MFWTVKLAPILSDSMQEMKKIGDMVRIVC